MKGFLNFASLEIDVLALKTLIYSADSNYILLELACRTNGGRLNAI